MLLCPHWESSHSSITASILLSICPSIHPVLSGYPVHLTYQRQWKTLQRSHQHDSPSVALFPGFWKSPALILTPAPLLCPLPLPQHTSSSTQYLLVPVPPGSSCLLRVGSLAPIKHKLLVSGPSSLRQTALLMFAHLHQSSWCSGQSPHPNTELGFTWMVAPCWEVCDADCQLSVTFMA